MNRFDRITITLILFLVGSLVACAETPSHEDGPRTFYESLALATPESTVGEFIDAFQREDYYTVFWIFTPKTQLAVIQKFNTLNYRDLIAVEGYTYDELELLLPEAVVFQPTTNWEHMTTAYTFDSLMFEAAKIDLLLVDLRRPTQLLYSTETDEPNIVDVYAEVEGISGEVVFRVKQLPSLNWRIVQVIVPNGNEEKIPWSVPE